MEQYSVNEVTVFLRQGHKLQALAIHELPVAEKLIFEYSYCFPPSV